MAFILSTTLTVGTYQPPAPVTYKGWWDADAGKSNGAMGAYAGGVKTLGNINIKGIYGAQASAGYFIYLELDVADSSWEYFRVSNGTQIANLKRTDATQGTSTYGNNAEYVWQVTSATWAFVSANGSIVSSKMVDGVLPLTGSISIGDLHYEYPNNPSTPPPSRSMSEFYRGGSLVNSYNADTFLSREPATGETYINSNTEFGMGYNQTSYTVRWGGSTVASGSGNVSTVTVGNTVYYRGTLRSSYAPYYYDYAVYRVTNYTDTYDVNQNVPTSGTISLSQFRGGSNHIPQ